MPEPVRAQTLLSVTLDRIYFQNGELWQPRYPTLIRDDNLVPQLQLEPAFQVFSEDWEQKVEVVFRIEEKENAVFATAEGEVIWQSLVPGDPAPDVEVELVKEKECRVLWTRTRPRVPLTALRIACRPHTVRDQPAPASGFDDAAALTLVEGGVYLAIVDRGEAPSYLKPLRNPTPPEPGRIRVVGIDVNSRPVYDLFKEDAGLPPALSPEPAFRAAHGEPLEFRLALALPKGPYDQARFKTEGGEVAMTYVVPSKRPDSMRGAPAAEEDRLCRLKWSAAPCTVGVTGTPCIRGRAFNLNAQLDPETLRGTLLEGTTAFSVDPTVIEPPACDASGVCTRPRDHVSRAATAEPADGTRGPRAAAQTRGAGTRRGRRIRGRGRGGR